VPRDGATTFGDLVGQLEELRVTCEKCGRAGRYRLDRLIAEHGAEAKIPDWIAKISSDCPKRQAASISDRCAIQCPDLLPSFACRWSEAALRHADRRALAALL
jgi:hypothetical protein